MSRATQRHNNLIRAALAIVLVLDVVLVVVDWRMGSSSPQAPRQELRRLQVQRELLAADVHRAGDIRRRLPEIQREYDEFFTKELREAASGYSSIEADLGGIAKQAGLKTDSITFRQHEVGNRGVTQVDVSTTVEGDYSSVVKFINGLERSANFYSLDSLTLASSTGGNLKLNLQLRTYFRS